MRKYELLILLKPNLKEDVKSKTVSLIEKILGGTIVKKEEWGLKKLAYPIKKEVESEYILYYVETKPQNIIKLKERINIVKEILRAMIILHEKEFPFNLKTTKDLKFPERKSRYSKNKMMREDRKPFIKKSGEADKKNRSLENQLGSKEAVANVE